MQQRFGNIFKVYSYLRYGYLLRYHDINVSFLSNLYLTLISTMYVLRLHHNRDFPIFIPFSPPTPKLSSLTADSNHSLILTTNLSTSSNVFPACKQILTRCVPSGTVGGTIGRTINPDVWRNWASWRGRELRREMMGEFGGCAGIWRIWGWGGSMRWFRVCRVWWKWDVRWLRWVLSFWGEWVVSDSVVWFIGMREVGRV